jgi:predicted TIM-barrel fold metal-dependent hydrolase
MMTVATLDNPLIRNIGPIVGRKADSRPGLMNLPPHTRLISADNHWELCEDIFFENFPAHLKDKAPRVWFDQFWRIGYRGKIEAFPTGDSRGARAMARCLGPGIADSELRYRDMDAENIEQEIVFPNTLMGFIRYPDLEVQENMYRVYNEHIAGRLDDTRSHPVAVFSNWWDSAKAESAMRQIVDLDFKSFIIPVNPGKTSNGREAFYGDAEYDRFWAVVAESGLPLCFHVGEGASVEHRGGVGATNLVLMAPFRKPFGQMVFGGVFDRHPNLKIVFAEGGLSWVPSALQDAEAIFDNFGNGDLVDRIELRPSEYWRRNCYATFQMDPLGMSELRFIGADRIMWATDYPHSEGAFGYGHAAVRAVVDAVPPDAAREILGATAAKVFRLN